MLNNPIITTDRSTPDQEPTTPQDIQRLLVEKPESILQRYRWEAVEASRLRKKLATPVNTRTGKPLKESTIKQYRSQYPGYAQSAADLKAKIRFLIQHRFMGTDRTRARWVNEMRDQLPTDYAEGLSDDERLFVEAYDGKPIKATRAAGHRGNYKTIRPIAVGYMTDPKIKSAILYKKSMRIPGLKVIAGGGEGDGKRFKTKPKKTEAGKPIALVSYIDDINEQLRKRAEIIWQTAMDEWRLMLEKRVESHGPRRDRLTKLQGLCDVSGTIKEKLYKLDGGSPTWDKVVADYKRLCDELAGLEKELGIHRFHYQGY